MLDFFNYLTSSININNIINTSDNNLEYLSNIYTTKGLLESFYIDKDIKPIVNNIPHPNGGYYDSYSITINNKKYYNHIIYNPINKILNNIQNNELKGILNNLDGYLATFKFIDENKQIAITNDMGVYAKNVFDFVISSVYDTLSRNESVNGLYYIVDKTEIKRLKIYKKIINLFLKYKSNYIDDINNKIVEYFLI